MSHTNDTNYIRFGITTQIDFHQKVFDIFCVLCFWYVQKPILPKVSLYFGNKLFEYSYIPNCDAHISFSRNFSSGKSNGKKPNIKGFYEKIGKFINITVVTGVTDFIFCGNLSWFWIIPSTMELRNSVVKFYILRNELKTWS